VNAYPDRKFTGKVEKLGYATANIFCSLPSSNNAGNYTKLMQVISVAISIDDDNGAGLVPVMNETLMQKVVSYDLFESAFLFYEGNLIVYFLV
jgi:multidrug resistance efflux pump